MVWYGMVRNGFWRVLRDAYQMHQIPKPENIFRKWGKHSNTTFTMCVLQFPLYYLDDF